MNITIVGAGNIGTQLAVHCAEKGHDVIIYGSNPEKINKTLRVVNENDITIHEGEICGATRDEEIAFKNAELIFVTMPATLMAKNASHILPYVKTGMKVCLVPGTGGGECAFKGCTEKGCVLLGIQRVPSVARLVEYGKTVRAVGYRAELHVAAIPQIMTDKCCGIIEELIGIKSLPLPNYLNITLTPSNPILHTTRLKILFEDWKEGKFYNKVPLFYEDWNDKTSELLMKCDDEVQELCRALPQFDLSYVKSLREHYESPTTAAMTKKISSIKGFKGLASPVVKTGEGYIPDFS